MGMNSYYNDTLYPLQNKVLHTIAAQSTPFYLTGGTALSRGYFGYRYSDDLDLFVNSDPSFLKYTDSIITALQQNFTLNMAHRSDSFISLKINEILKLEFINDVTFHSGQLEKKPFFPKVDNVLNILSNKLSALLSRDEPKDVVDIWVIAKNIKVNWPTIFQDANSKAVGIFPPDIAKRLLEFPAELLDLIKWTPNHKPDLASFKKDLAHICDAILA